MVIFRMQSVTQLLTDVAGFFNTYLCSCILFLILNHFAASDPQALKLRDKRYRRVRKMLLSCQKCDLVCCALWVTDIKAHILYWGFLFIWLLLFQDPSIRFRQLQFSSGAKTSAIWLLIFSPLFLFSSNLVHNRLA